MNDVGRAVGGYCDFSGPFPSHASRRLRRAAGGAPGSRAGPRDERCGAHFASNPVIGLRFSSALVAAVSVVVVWSGAMSQGEAAPPRHPPSASPPASAKTKSGPAGGNEVDPYEGLDHTGTPSLPPREDRLPPQSAPPGKKRPVPNFEGRPPARTSAGEALIWIPRVLFYPVHLVLEYGLRVPVVSLINVLEKHHVIERVKDFFSFAGGKGLIYPSFIVDLGRFASVGIHFSYKDLVVPTNNLSFVGAFSDGEFVQLALSDTFRVFRDNSGTVTFRAGFLNRPDQVFHGLGPNTLQAAQSFFRLGATDLAAQLRGSLGGLHRASLELAYRNATISGGQNPSVNLPAARAFFDVDDPTQVPGYNHTYNLLTTKLRLELDSRSPQRQFTPGSGVRFEAFGSFSVDPGDTRLRFLRWGAEAAGFVDLSGNNHVLSLQFHLEALEATAEARVPISERIFLGGQEFLRGFLEGRFRGDSAMVLTLQYRYPIWHLFDANLHVSLGNVFTGRFDDLSFKRMVMSWGIGFRTTMKRDTSFEIMVGFGSNQLADWDGSFRVDSIRFAFGVNQGF